MDKRFVPLDLSDLPKIDKVANKDDIINGRKVIGSIIRDSRTQAKLAECYYCGKPCTSFCNSHSIPMFCLKRITINGKVCYFNTILDFPVLNDDKGLIEAGTFHLICQDCDGKVFRDYESPDNYSDMPTTRMLAQIDMKNCLKNISKRLIEIEMYDLMKKRTPVTANWTDSKKSVSEFDLKEFMDSYTRAKKRSLKPHEGDYYVGFYEKLPYVVPVAFQGTIALISDLDGNIINNIYSDDPKYVIRSMALCIFPIENSSVVMIFVDNDNRRYARFFKQLKKMSHNERLSIINYILFSYCEDYFLSPKLTDATLSKLKRMSGKTPDMIAVGRTTNFQQLEKAKEIFNYNERFSIPNVLDENYKVY